MAARLGLDAHGEAKAMTQQPRQHTHSGGMPLSMQGHESSLGAFHALVSGLPHDSPLFLPVLPVEPSPTTGIQHCIPPLFHGSTARVRALASVARPDQSQHNLKPAEPAPGASPAPAQQEGTQAAPDTARNSEAMAEDGPVQVDPSATMSEAAESGQQPNNGPAGQWEDPSVGQAYPNNGGTAYPPGPAARGYGKQSVANHDGWQWRKYGEKLVKNSVNPRSYYKCSHINCTAKKIVERNDRGEILNTEYKGDHSHPAPAIVRGTRFKPKPAKAQAAVVGPAANSRSKAKQADRAYEPRSSGAGYQAASDGAGRRSSRYGSRHEADGYGGSSQGHGADDDDMYGGDDAMEEDAAGDEQHDTGHHAGGGDQYGADQYRGPNWAHGGGGGGRGGGRARSIRSEPAFPFESPSKRLDMLAAYAEQMERQYQEHGMFGGDDQDMAAAGAGGGGGDGSDDQQQQGGYGQQQQQHYEDQGNQGQYCDAQDAAGHRDQARPSPHHPHQPSRRVTKRLTSDMDNAAMEHAQHGQHASFHQLAEHQGGNGTGDGHTGNRDSIGGGGYRHNTAIGMRNDEHDGNTGNASNDAQFHHHGSNGHGNGYHMGSNGQQQPHMHHLEPSGGMSAGYQRGGSMVDTGGGAGGGGAAEEGSWESTGEETGDMWRSGGGAGGPGGVRMSEPNALLDDALRWRRQGHRSQRVYGGRRSYPGTHPAPTTHETDNPTAQPHLPASYTRDAATSQLEQEQQQQMLQQPLLTIQALDTRQEGMQAQDDAEQQQQHGMMLQHHLQQQQGQMGEAGNKHHHLMSRHSHNGVCAPDMPAPHDQDSSGIDEHAAAHHHYHHQQHVMPISFGSGHFAAGPQGLLPPGAFPMFATQAVLTPMLNYPYLPASMQLDQFAMLLQPRPDAASLLAWDPATCLVTPKVQGMQNLAAPGLVAPLGHQAHASINIVPAGNRAK